MLVKITGHISDVIAFYHEYAATVRGLGYNCHASNVVNYVGTMLSLSAWKSMISIYVTLINSSVARLANLFRYRDIAGSYLRL